MNMKTPEDILNMSDEDFLKGGNYIPPNEEESNNKENTVTEENNNPSVEENPIEKEHIENNVNENKENTNDEEKEKQEEVKENTVEETQEPSINFENSYKELLAPFKANGKIMDIKSPEEARKLMQMGANYTKKMQELQPSRKIVATLQKHGLTDENELNFLIDIKNKNPEAIKKLLKDSNINPMDLDLEEASTYRAGNNHVSNEEANFRSTLDDIASTPTGNELIGLIQNQWDEASKDALWKNPNILNDLNSHKENGNFDIINNEIDRRKMMGTLSSSIPYLEAYNTVGQDLAKQAMEQKTKQPIATRVATKEPVISNNAQAKAAATTRVASKQATKTDIKNPLSLSDDEFMEYMQKRKG